MLDSTKCRGGQPGARALVRALLRELLPPPRERRPQRVVVGLPVVCLCACLFACEVPELCPLHIFCEKILARGKSSRTSTL